MDEDGETTYQVRLATKPSDDVTVTVARKSGNDQDTDLSVKTGASLTFTSSNWSTDQNVVLAAAEDADALNGTAVFTHTAKDGGYDNVSAELTATERDSDSPGIVLTPDRVTVRRRRRSQLPGETRHPALRRRHRDRGPRLRGTPISR